MRAVTQNDVPYLRTRTGGPTRRDDNVARLQGVAQLTVPQNRGLPRWCEDATNEANVRSVGLRGNQHVERIKQQRSDCPMGCPCIGRAAVVQQPVTRHLDEAPVAAFRAALSE